VLESNFHVAHPKELSIHPKRRRDAPQYHAVIANRIAARKVTLGQTLEQTQLERN